MRFWGEDLFRERMLGGIFEGSNRPDFVDADTLYIITDVPARLNTVAGSYSDKAYRYLRYKGPADSHCNVAEIAFYEKGDTASVKGKPIGTPGCFYNDGTHEYMNAFDGKTWTSFDYSHPSGGWAGLDLGRKVCIDHIVYTPRNRDNYIRPGDVYELFYCDCHWKSAGTVKAASDSLVFCGIPENVLLFYAIIHVESMNGFLVTKTKFNYGNKNEWQIDNNCQENHRGSKLCFTDLHLLLFLFGQSEYSFSGVSSVGHVDWTVSPGLSTFPLTGIVRVDGKTYRFCGGDSLRMFPLASFSEDDISGWKCKYTFISGKRLGTTGM